MKLLVINGPNLNLLGLREPAIYGSQNYESLLALIRAACDAEGIEVGFVQSNHEGTIVDAIQAAYGVYDGIIINPAAYTHTSIAILDALKASGCDEVKLVISGPLSPMKVVPPEGDQFLFLVLPVRLKAE